MSGKPQFAQNTIILVRFQLELEVPMTKNKLLPSPRERPEIPQTYYSVSLCDTDAVRDLHPDTFLTNLTFYQYQRWRSDRNVHIPPHILKFLWQRHKYRIDRSPVTAEGLQVQHLEGYSLSDIPQGHGIGTIWKQRLAAARYRAGMYTPVGDVVLLAMGLRSQDAKDLTQEKNDNARHTKYYAKVLKSDGTSGPIPSSLLTLEHFPYDGMFDTKLALQAAIQGGVLRFKDMDQLEFIIFEARAVGIGKRQPIILWETP